MLTVTDVGVAKSDSNTDQFWARVCRCTFATKDLRYSGRLSRRPVGWFHGKGYVVMDKRSLPANANRFELEQDGQVGYLIYEIDGQGWITLWHTEVPQALRGQGLGAKLLRMAFDYAEANHLIVEPICPFAISFVAKHPEVRPFVGKRSATGRGPSEVI